MELDLRTVYVVAGVAGLGISLVLLLMMRALPALSGSREMAASGIIGAISLLILALQGRLSPLALFVATNLAAYLCMLLAYAGVTIFYRRRVRWRLAWSVLVAVMAALTGGYLAHVQPEQRTTLFTLGAVFFLGMKLWTLAGVERGSRTLGYWLMTVISGEVLLVTALRLGVILLQPISTSTLEPHPINLLHGISLTLLLVFGTLAFILMGHERLRAMLERLAFTDDLTGALNRRAFLDALTRARAGVRRSGRPCGLLTADLDHFKSINDRHGHPAGDTVLQEFVRRSTRCLRPSDLVGRLGGEEFGILLPEAGPEQLREVGERIRLALEGAPVPWEGLAITATVSIGATSLRADDPEEATSLSRADRALYLAKEQRNRVVLG